MKKIISIICSIMLACVFLLAGCGEPAAPPAGTPSLRLRSEKQQALKVGEGMTLVWSTANTDQGVSFSSSDEAVVTVDDYGSVDAVGVGEADVTVALKEVPSVSETVHFKITRTFFMQENGYRNGTIDFSGDETGEPVYIKDGQAQLLVNSEGQSWYFKCHLKRTGCTNGDQWGRWGVGSFLVNSASPIGEVMFWAGFQNRDENANMCVPYYGGWRTTAGAQEAEVELSGPVTMGGEADVTIIRLGTKHYVIFDCGETPVKTIVDIAKFDGKDTFPGVYAQNQLVEVSGYDASNDPEKVKTVLDEFQIAEEIVVNGLDSRLVAGREYELTASVLPDITINKNVIWSLETEKSGVSLTSSGRLALSMDVRGEITMRATAESGKNVTATRTFTVIEGPVSQSSLFDTGLLIGESGNVTMEETSVTFSAGENYLPLRECGERYYVSATVQGAEQQNGARAGFLSTTAGYMRYFRFGLLGDVGAARHAEFGEGYGESAVLNYAANNDVAHGFARENEIGLLKDGANYYFFANGKMIARKRASFSGETIPVLYAEGCAVTFRNVSVVTDAGAIDALLARHKFFVGGYVTKEENVYTLASVDFGEANNMNWPPDNDYVNGLKFAEAVKGDYTVEFTMSEIKPYGSTYDAKVLVYLKSERVTSSLQFIIKGNAAFPTVALCVNLDDASWEEYKLPEGVNILGGATQVKIVKNAAGAGLWLNGQKVTQLFTKTGETREADALMHNNGYWNANTACTPGIGSFKCGVTIADPVITLG